MNFFDGINEIKERVDEQNARNDAEMARLNSQVKANDSWLKRLTREHGRETDKRFDLAEQEFLAALRSIKASTHSRSKDVCEHNIALIEAIREIVNE